MGFGWNDVWVDLELVLMVDVGCVWISELSHITTFNACLRMFC